MRTLLSAARVAALTTLVLLPGTAPFATAAQEATPAASCRDAATGSPTTRVAKAETSATPMADKEHETMDMTTGTHVDIDQMYIDMMIPHHQSIIALARAALPLLSDERLREITEAVMATQQPEIDELQTFRAANYGEATPMPMDGAMMSAMHAMMPGLSGTMDEMTALMDAESLVAAFCAAENPDLAFIDLTIPHHQMAIDASVATVQQAAHPEIRDLAQRVIDAQQREIEMLTAIREKLAGTATPAGS